METRNRSLLITLSALFLFQPVYAQSSGNSNSILIASLIIIGLFLLIGAIFSLSDNLLQIEAKKSGADTKKHNYSLFPNISELIGRSNPAYTAGNKVIHFKKGYNINLEGAALQTLDTSAKVSRFSVRPPDFRMLPPIPRLTVQEGDEVLAGDVLFHDKNDDRIKYVSPVSGEVTEIKRGAKRAITDVIVLADKTQKYKQFDVPDLSKADRESIVSFLLESGGWTFINQRPFDILPEPDSIPKNIFISTFDSAPLAPNLNFVVSGKEEAFQKGLDVLGKLTPGKVVLGLDARSDDAVPSDSFVKAEGVETNWFSGPHPSGNVGVQIHHTYPIGNSDKVWTLGVQEVISLGNLFLKGIFDATRLIAVCGADLKKTKYVQTYVGANVNDLLKGNVTVENVRLVSGDVLSGSKVRQNEFLRYRDDQLTVLREGDYYEAIGWLIPDKIRPSISKTFPSFLFPNLKHEADTNTHGEKRAFVMTGQYESVMPMDILPQHLMKAIMTGDFERMEGLGIMELTEEDVALCEFVCTSKMPLQSILRDGLEMMMEQA